MYEYANLAHILKNCATGAVRCSDCPFHGPDEDPAGCICKLELNAADAIRELVEKVGTLEFPQLPEIKQLKAQIEQLKAQIEQLTGQIERKENILDLARQEAVTYREKYHNEKKKVEALLDLIVRSHKHDNA